MAIPQPQYDTSREAAVISGAVVRVADQLGLSGRLLAKIIGVSEATVSRLRAGRATLDPEDKSFELAVHLIRLYRSLDAIVGGSESAARHWLNAPNRQFADNPPVEQLTSITGLIDVVDYLDHIRGGG